MSDSKVKISALFREWLGLNCIVLDTETTGLGDDAEVVEISLIDASGAVLLDTLVKPSKPIPEEVTKIHGITNEMVANAPTWADIHDEFISIITNRVVVIYNAQYDVRVLLQTVDLNNLDAYMRREMMEALGSKGVACAMLAYAEFWGDWNDSRGSYRWQRLEAAARQQGVTIDGTAHRALCDVKTTLGVIQAVAANYVY